MAAQLSIFVFDTGAEKKSKSGPADMSSAANNSHLNSAAARKANVDYCSKYFLRSVLYVFNFVFWVSIKIYITCLMEKFHDLSNK